MKFIVIVPENKFVMKVLSRHKVLGSARKKTSNELHVYELLEGDSPSVGDLLSREDVADRFRHAMEVPDA